MRWLLAKSRRAYTGFNRSLRTSMLHPRLHTNRTFDEEQVDLNEKEPTCGAFAEPSSGLEPETPFVPSSPGPLRRAADSCEMACLSRDEARLATRCRRLRPVCSISAPTRLASKS